MLEKKTSYINTLNQLLNTTQTLADKNEMNALDVRVIENYLASALNLFQSMDEKTNLQKLNEELDKLFFGLRSTLFSVKAKKPTLAAGVFAHNTLLFITSVLPKNSKHPETQELLDPISNLAIAKGNEIVTSTGYIFDIFTLSDFINQAHQYIHPVTQKKFDEMDIIEIISAAQVRELSLPFQSPNFSMSHGNLVENTFNVLGELSMQRLINPDRNSENDVITHHYYDAQGNLINTHQNDGANIPASSVAASLSALFNDVTADLQASSAPNNPPSPSMENVD